MRDILFLVIGYSIGTVVCAVVIYVKWNWSQRK